MGDPSARKWYRPADITRANVAVRILLPGGEATGVLRSERGVTAWRVLRDSGAADDLGFEPFGWRPLDAPGATPWPDPLPEPMILSQSGRMTDVRPRKLAAMQRQAEESARVQAALVAEYGEIDAAPRAAAGSLVARCDSPAGSRPQRAASQWWLDPAAVTYSEPGAIDILEAEARVARAILTDGLRAMEKPAGFAAVSAGLAGLVAETLRSEDADRRPRFEPTARDHADYLTAFAWFAAVAPIELRPRWAGIDWLSGAQKVLVWQALVPPLSWRQIARRAGGSQEGWRKTWGGALACVHRVANGGQPMPHVKVSDQLAALRERNHAWKRRVRDPVAEIEGALAPEAWAAGGNHEAG